MSLGREHLTRVLRWRAGGDLTGPHRRSANKQRESRKGSSRKLVSVLGFKSREEDEERSKSEGRARAARRWQPPTKGRCLPPFSAGPLTTPPGWPACQQGSGRALQRGGEEGRSRGEQRQRGWVALIPALGAAAGRNPMRTSLQACPGSGMPASCLRPRSRRMQAPHGARGAAAKNPPTSHPPPKPTLAVHGPAAGLLQRDVHLLGDGGQQLRGVHGQRLAAQHLRSGGWVGGGGGQSVTQMPAGVATWC